jgi:hypothetical protein
MMNCGISQNCAKQINDTQITLCASVASCFIYGPALFGYLGLLCMWFLSITVSYMEARDGAVVEELRYQQEFAHFDWNFVFSLI